MLIELDDFAEMSKNLRLRSVSKIFILKDFIPSIKSLSPEQIIKFTKERKITEQDWINFLDYHKFGNFNRFPLEVNRLRSAFMLSGKKEDYPLHVGVLGPPGTKKTMGYIETFAYKFAEEPIICEGANSRIKGLIPSFKEKPANIGYIAKCERMGFIDEIGKMVEFESTKGHYPIINTLGELNFLLEHKLRTVGSGNDNDIRVKATGKNLFVTNTIASRKTISHHVGLIDPTFMSRVLWWVQDEEEKEFLLSDNCLESVPITHTQAQAPKKNTIIDRNKRKTISNMKNCSRDCLSVIGKMNREEFLTLFDSCYNFVCDIDDEEVQKLVNTTTMLAKEPMKSSVWKPRATHHVFLLIDGLCKHRCLFKDYDVLFKANQEDYDAAERILVRMVNGWETNLQPKEEVYDTR